MDKTLYEEDPIGTLHTICVECHENLAISWMDETLDKDRIFTLDNIPFYLFINRVVGREVRCDHCGSINVFYDPFYSAKIDARRYQVNLYALTDRELEGMAMFRKRYASCLGSEYEMRYRDRTNSRSPDDMIRFVSDTKYIKPKFPDNMPDDVRKDEINKAQEHMGKDIEESGDETNVSE